MKERNLDQQLLARFAVDFLTVNFRVRPYVGHWPITSQFGTPVGGFDKIFDKLTEGLVSFHILVLIIDGTNVDEFVIIYGTPRKSHESSIGESQILKDG